MNKIESEISVYNRYFYFYSNLKFCYRAFLIAVAFPKISNVSIDILTQWEKLFNRKLVLIFRFLYKQRYSI